MCRFSVLRIGRCPWDCDEEQNKGPTVVACCPRCCPPTSPLSLFGGRKSHRKVAAPPVIIGRLQAHAESTQTKNGSQSHRSRPALAPFASVLSGVLQQGVVLREARAYGGALHLPTLRCRRRAHPSSHSRRLWMLLQLRHQARRQQHSPHGYRMTATKSLAARVTMSVAC